ncbi:MAG: ribosomal protein S21 [Candidatus Paceibacteria bacterium]|jgi:ribosomal protein S21
MAINVQLDKKPNENSLSMLKRFNRKVQESGILRRVRSIRYMQREPSKYTKKEARLTSIKKKTEIELQIKLGKISENPRRKGRR